LAQALEGTELEVPTLDGKVRIWVPANTSSDKVFNLKGLGMPILHQSGRGDLKVKIRVKVPTR
jgi:molecular chaperone DnaJ